MQKNSIGQSELKVLDFVEVLHVQQVSQASLVGSYPHNFLLLFLKQ